MIFGDAKEVPAVCGLNRTDHLVNGRNVASEEWNWHCADHSYGQDREDRGWSARRSAGTGPYGGKGSIDNLATMYRWRVFSH